MSHPYTIVAKADGSETLTVLLPDGPETVDDKHPNYSQIKALVVSQGPTEDEALSAETVAELVDVEAAISNCFEQLSERVSVANGKVYFDGDEVRGAITDHIRG